MIILLYLYEIIGDWGGSLYALYYAVLEYAVYIMQFLALYAVLEFLLTSASHWPIKNEKSETAYFDIKILNYMVQFFLALHAVLEF